MMVRHPILVALTLVLVINQCVNGDYHCNQFYYDNVLSKAKCEERPLDDKVPYAPQIRAAYCFNNGTGICKLIAGRYEFYGDVWNDRFLYSAPYSKHVDANGYHARIPVAYQVDGSPLYVDRALNWADEFVAKAANNTVNLFSISSFNWCAYTVDALWPYKSAIKKGKYHIYFFNRQSCIYDTEKKRMQHYNTRFLHISDLRIDLDMNPTIFAMEDNLAKSIRLVKHKRQHWYEVDFQVLESPTPNIDYFVDMNIKESLPSVIDGKRAILSSKAYNSSLCMTDLYTQRMGTSSNNNLLLFNCGDREVEMADMNRIQMKAKRPDGAPERHFTVTLHNIPYDDKSPFLNDFFGVGKKNTEKGEIYWYGFATDGLVFSAVTTIPIPNDSLKVRVLMLYAEYYPPPDDKYDEFYPRPKFSDYVASYDPRRATGSYWDISDRKAKEKDMKDLNYVDDIAYLYKCDTVLTIFGPLYTEQAAKGFSPDTKTKLGSITKLGMWEITSAFFAEPDTDILWAHHRSNLVGMYRYTCGSNGALVTAIREGKYVYNDGKTTPNNWAVIWNDKPKLQYDMSEEWLFQKIGVFKGSLDSPEPPDPIKYKEEIQFPTPEDESSSSWIYWVIGVSVLLILAMAILCLMTVRRWRRKRMQKTRRSGALSSMSNAKTRRTSLSSASHGSSLVPLTDRSKLSSSQSIKGLSKSRSSQGSRATTRSSKVGPGRSTVRSIATKATSQGTGATSSSTGSHGSLKSQVSQGSHGSHGSHGSLGSHGSKPSHKSSPTTVKKFSTG